VIRGQGQGHKGAKLEAHRRYIDIQYCVTGSDVIGWKPASTCRDPEQAYDEQKDLQFFRDAADSWVTIPQGSFGIFCPEDAHAPAGAEGPIHKVVVKVAVDWS
jgi:YhcH/YjgK/YiaL family protein